MIDNIKKAIISSPDDPSRYAAAGYYAKNILGLAGASQLIWITCRPFTMGMAIPVGGVVRSHMIDQSPNQSPEKKTFIRGTLLPMFLGAYVAGAFMGFATAVKLAANAPSKIRAFGWIIAHLLLIPLPLTCNAFLFVVDAGLSPGEWPSPEALSLVYKKP
jgi:hypothetical protein